MPYAGLRSDLKELQVREHCHSEIATLKYYNLIKFKDGKLTNPRLKMSAKNERR